LNNYTQTSVSLILLGCSLSSFTIYSAEFESYQLNEPASFSLTDLKGKTHQLADYHGKVVLVNFWASWCLPCIQELPELTKLQQHLDQRADNKKTFIILAVNTGESDYRARASANRINFKLPVLLDSSSALFNKWNGRIMPTSYLIDGSGRIRYRAIGNPGWDDEGTLLIIKNVIDENEGRNSGDTDSMAID